MREFARYINNPELLLTPPAEVILDPGVDKKKLRKF
jgi:hypothetical protein